MAECNWDPSKHGGNSCPTHGAGGAGNQGGHKIRINGGKYQVKLSDDSDWEEISPEEYNELREGGYQDFDETVDDDFGFDEDDVSDEEYDGSELLTENDMNQLKTYADKYEVPFDGLKQVIEEEAQKLIDKGASVTNAKNDAMESVLDDVVSRGNLESFLKGDEERENREIEGDNLYDVNNPENVPVSASQNTNYRGNQTEEEVRNYQEKKNENVIRDNFSRLSDHELEKRKNLYERVLKDETNEEYKKQYSQELAWLNEEIRKRNDDNEETYKVGDKVRVQGQEYIITKIDEDGHFEAKGVDGYGFGSGNLKDKTGFGGAPISIEKIEDNNSKKDDEAFESENYRTPEDMVDGELMKQGWSKEQLGKLTKQDYDYLSEMYARILGVNFKKEGPNKVKDLVEK